MRSKILFSLFLSHRFFRLVATPIRVTLICPGLVGTEFFEVLHNGDKEKGGAWLKGFQELRPEDLADNICYAASRPGHVNIAKMVTLPTNQATGTMVHRE